MVLEEELPFEHFHQLMLWLPWSIIERLVSRNKENLSVGAF
jgi:hypothetical protein